MGYKESDIKDGVENGKMYIFPALRDNYMPRWSNHDLESGYCYPDIAAPNGKTYTRRYDLQAKKWASLIYNKDGTIDRVVYDDQRTDKET